MRTCPDCTTTSCGPHTHQSVPTGAYGTVVCPSHPKLRQVVRGGREGYEAIRDHLTEAHTDDEPTETGRPT